MSRFVILYLLPGYVGVDSSFVDLLLLAAAVPVSGVILYPLEVLAQGEVPVDGEVGEHCHVGHILVLTHYKHLIQDCQQPVRSPDSLTTSLSYTGHNSLSNFCCS